MSGSGSDTCRIEASGRGGFALVSSWFAARGAPVTSPICSFTECLAAVLAYPSCGTAWAAAPVGLFLPYIERDRGAGFRTFLLPVLSSLASLGRLVRGLACGRLGCSMVFMK